MEDLLKEKASIVKRTTELLEKLKVGSVHDRRFLKNWTERVQVLKGVESCRLMR